jgi:hypothetical protein
MRDTLENTQFPEDDELSAYNTDEEANGKRKSKKGNKAPTKQDIVSWVEKAWYSISAATVVKSFKCTGIANALDGSEDDLITVDLNRPVS